MSISPSNEDAFLTDFDAFIAAAPDEEPASATVAAPLPISSNIIPIRREEGKATVNARDLHTFLQVGKRFTTWLEERVETFGFTVGQDFFPILGESQGGRPSKEFILTLDMAKELPWSNEHRGENRRASISSSARRTSPKPPPIPSPSSATPPPCARFFSATQRTFCA